MNHYQKIAVVILRSVGCCFVVYSLAGSLYGITYSVLLANRDDSLVGVVTNVLSCLSYMLAGAALYVLSRPLAYLIAGKFKNE